MENRKGVTLRASAISTHHFTCPFANFNSVHGAIVVIHTLPSGKAATPIGCRGASVPSSRFGMMWCHGFGLPAASTSVVNVGLATPTGPWSCGAANLCRL